MYLASSFSLVTETLFEGITALTEGCDGWGAIPTGAAVWIIVVSGVSDLF